ncbi:MAG: hypothetical protein IT293_15915 [Deltaproteobacteria bacterium]|nr:hypothetical protein [Deltaproteobacteria bacterium]
MKRKESAAVGAMVEELTRVARELGFDVREEELLRDVGYRPRSGVCRLGGRDVILMDRKLSGPERVEVLCAALAERDLEQVFLSPALRALIGGRKPAAMAEA